MILMARNMTVPNYGEFIFGYTFARYSAILLPLGSGVDLIRFWGRSQLDIESKKKYCFGLLNYYLRRALLFFLLVFLSLVPLFKFSILSSVEIISIVFTLPLLAIIFLQNYFTAVEKAFIGGLISSLYSLFLIISIFVLSYLEITNTNLFISLLVITSMSVVIVIYLKSDSQYVAIKPDISDTKHLSFSHIFTTIFFVSDIIFLKLFSNSVNVASFGVAFFLLSIIQFMLGSVTSVILPKLSSYVSSANLIEAAVKIKLAVRFASFPALLVVILIYFFASQIVNLFGNDFSNSAYILQILLIGSFANVISGPNGWILNITGHQTSVALIAAVLFVIKALISFIVLTYYDIIAFSILSTSITVLFQICLTYTVYNKLKFNCSIF